MNKIPTLFERDWNGDRSKVTEQVHAGCEWVLAGEGVATRKLDGTCCMIRDGKMYRRRELKAGQPEPAGFESLGTDEETGKTVGWVPVGEGPDDQYHRRALSKYQFEGTCELIGPKIQGNPEHQEDYRLVDHNDSELVLPDVPRTFEGLRAWMTDRDIEGVVWHHPDGRMAKLKLRDFGLVRSPQ